MRFSALLCLVFVSTGCGLFQGLEGDPGETDTIETGNTVETGSAVETGNTVETGDTVETGETGEAPNDVEPKSGDYDFAFNGTFIDSCMELGGEGPDAGEFLFTGNALVASLGVAWVLDEGPEVEAEWIGDNKFRGLISEMTQTEEIDGLRATLVHEQFWYGEWSTNVDLTAGIDLTIRCVGQDCQQAESDYAQEKGVVLPCSSGFGLDGAFAR